uniref:Tripartite motif containing 45 n=1 Tax=Oncorhynchus kisutch TaxID=8019 RepID=A0A8C7G7F9_ONCKI
VHQLERFSVSSGVHNGKTVHLEDESPSSAVKGLCPECDSEVDIPLSGLVTGLLLSRLDRLEESLRKLDLSQEVLQARMDATADEVRSFARGYASAVESHCLSLLRCLVELRLQCRNQLHLQRAQLQQALSDARGGMAFTERLLMCGSDSENLSAKGVTLRRLGNLSAGKVRGYPVVEVIHAKTLELSRCTIEGEGKTQTKALVTCVFCSRLEVAVVDNSDGSYSISYTPVEPGSYSMWDQPRVRGHQVSPFVLNVKRKVQWHCGTFHCCSFCSSGGSKEARCGCTGTMPGGFRGCDHGHKGLPGKPHWSCCGSVVEASDSVGGTGSGSPRGHLRTVQL